MRYFFGPACDDDMVQNVPAEPNPANGFVNFSGQQSANFSPCLGLSTNAVPKRNRDEGAVNTSDDDAPMCARGGAVKAEPLKGSKKA